MATMIKIHATLILIALIGTSFSTATFTPSKDIITGDKQLPFLIPRGGGNGGNGWFRGGNKNNSNKNRKNFSLPRRQKRRRNQRDSSKDRNGSGGGGGGDDGKIYPALTQEEIEEKLNIPVFGITDTKGNCIVADDEEQNSLVYFFLSRQMAEVALESIRESIIKNNNKNNNGGTEDDVVGELKISALHLGKIWYRLLNNDDDVMVSLRKLKKDDASSNDSSTSSSDDDNLPTSSSSSRITKKVSFRLIPGQRDLLGARILTGLNTSEVQKLKIAIENNAKDEVQTIIKRATIDSKNFTLPYNQIPLFVMPNMRVSPKHHQQQQQQQQQEGGSSSLPTAPLPSTSSSPELLPIFFGAKNMVDAYLSNIRHNKNDISNNDNNQALSEDFNTNNVNVQLIELHELVKLMQDESKFDFRSIIFFPSVQEDGDNNNDTNDDDDSDDDDDDDGGGGDNSLKSQQEEPRIEIYQQQSVDDQYYSPYVSMELGVFNNDQDSGREEIVRMM